jgi:hypothetical protein
MKIDISTHNIIDWLEDSFIRLAKSRPDIKYWLIQYKLKNKKRLTTDMTKEAAFTLLAPIVLRNRMKI